MSLPADTEIVDLGLITDPREKYNQILKFNGINASVCNVSVQDENSAGYLSVSKCVTVAIENESNLRENLRFFVKEYPVDDESLCEILDAWKSFEKEALFYNKYIPMATKLCKNIGRADLMDIYPKCFYANKKEIVLKNLADKGFSIVDREEMLNLDETTFALKTLAKHHAISLAMIKSSGGKKQFFEDFLNLDFQPFIQPQSEMHTKSNLEVGLRRNIQMLQKTKVNGWEDCVAKLEPFAGKVYELMVKHLTEELNTIDLPLLNHGDYWMNNLMFARNTNTHQVIGHLVVDMQMTNYNSAAEDLSFFIFTSVKLLVRQNNLKKLLKIYLTTLKEAGSDLGCDINITDEEFLNTYKRKCLFGFWIAICFASGPIHAIGKDTNIFEIGDINKLHEPFPILHEWMDKNWEKSVQISKHIVETVNEYFTLITDM